MRLCFVVLFAVLLFSCRNENAGSENERDTVDSAHTPPMREANKITVPPYSVELSDDGGSIHLNRDTANFKSIEPQDMVVAFNEKYKAIPVELIKVENGTVELKIKDARKLTQEMGSAGAQAYLAELTFSFTELKGISAVELDFQEGDHAMPGVYTREDFQDFIK